MWWAAARPTFRLGAQTKFSHQLPGRQYPLGVCDDLELMTISSFVALSEHVAPLR
jgi:hypothetical protein